MTQSQWRTASYDISIASCHILPTLPPDVVPALPLPTTFSLAPLSPPFCLWILWKDEDVRSTNFHLAAAAAPWEDHELAHALDQSLVSRCSNALTEARGENQANRHGELKGCQ